MKLNPAKSFLYVFLVLFFVSQIVSSQNKTKDSIASQIIENLVIAKKNIESNDLQKTFVTLIKAKKLLSNIENDSLTMSVRYSLAEVYYYIQNYEKASAEIEKILLISNNKEKNIDLTQIAKTYTLYGLILSKLNQFEKAERYLKKAEYIYSNVTNEIEKANLLLVYALLAIEKEEFNKAINYFNLAIPTFENNNISYQLASSKLKKGEAILRDPSIDLPNKVDIAQKVYEEALEILKVKKYPSLKIESHKVAGYLNIEKENFKQAIFHFERYAIEKEKLYQEHIDIIAQSIEEESKISDLSQIIEIQKNDIFETKQSMNFIKMTTGLSIALIVILSLFTLSLHKNNNLRANANKILRDKNIELQLSKEKAEQASQAKIQFLSTVTHELRTPLYAVTGLTHLLLEDNPHKHQKEHLNSLRLSGEYLLSLINNILDLNKLEANKVEIEHVTFDLKKRINEVMISLKKSAESKQNTLQLEYDDTIPEKLKGDPLVISQILINLIGNSVKFTQNGAIVVRVVNVNNNNNKKVTLHFEVEDNGVGVSNTKQQTIFDSFNQGSLQINRTFGGTGLGLSIVKNLLELLGSKIELESTLGKGSKFWFNITFDVDSTNLDTSSNPEINIASDLDNVSDKHILIVEDNKINQMITRKILEKQNINCKVASNGLDAVKLAQEHTFDIILMDIHMPGISGIEATKKIREFNTQIPIIALTAVTIDENINEFYQAGFNDIIPKPFKTDFFFNRIQKALNAKINS